MHFTLIGRSWCHLCDDMRAAVLGAFGEHEHTLEDVDLERHPEWEDRFGMLIPVLLAGTAPDGAEICHYHFDPVRFEAACANGLK
jgi:hypothetical protein